MWNLPAHSRQRTERALHYSERQSVLTADVPCPDQISKEGSWSGIGSEMERSRKQRCAIISYPYDCAERWAEICPM